MRIIPIIICILLGLAFAVALRFNVFVSAIDFTYIKFGSITYIAPGWNKWISDNSRNLQVPPERHALNNKAVFGQSGLPFPVFSDCVLGGYRDGVMYRSLQVRCKTIFLGEKSIFFNGIFWSATFYCLWLLIKLILKSFPWGKGRI